MNGVPETKDSENVLCILVPGFHLDEAAPVRETAQTEANADHHQIRVQSPRGCS
jgi:hypothetical protein